MERIQEWLEYQRQYWRVPEAVVESTRGSSGEYQRQYWRVPEAVLESTGGSTGEYQRQYWRVPGRQYWQRLPEDSNPGELARAKAFPFICFHFFLFPFYSFYFL